MSVPTDTIFALSSGRLPAAIAILRISGPDAGGALAVLTGRSDFEPRAATMARFSDEAGELIDRGIVLFFPAPRSNTGEDVGELHVHGSVAVVAALEARLGAIGLRPAQAGEFTRRALLNGRMDLPQAEGLAALLDAETEAQRRAAMRVAGGEISRLVDGWRASLIDAAARVEAAIDFSDEGDVGTEVDIAWSIALVVSEVEAILAAPPAERLRDGFRVVVAGPVNAGKSTLINALANRDVSITSPQAGTTRDVIEAPVALGSIPIVLVDTAGWRNAPADPIEAEGIARATRAIENADLVLWLGPPQDKPNGQSVLVRTKADVATVDAGEALRLSALTGEGLPELRQLLMESATQGLGGSTVLTNARQRQLLRQLGDVLRLCQAGAEITLVAEDLRAALAILDQLTGRSAPEAVLDRIFSSFCIGK